MSKNKYTDNIDDNESEEAKIEYNIIKYALNFLVANLDEDILEDVSDILDVGSLHELEYYVQDIIDNY